MIRFIACQQTLALSAGKDGEPLVALDNEYFRSVTDLVDDDIEGVRIGVARFAGLIYGISISIFRFLHLSNAFCVRKPASPFAPYPSRIAGSYQSTLPRSLSWSAIICTCGRSATSLRQCIIRKFQAIAEETFTNINFFKTSSVTGPKWRLSASIGIIRVI